MNIIHKLSIKDNISTIENNSLVNAVNMNITDDGLLQNDFSIVDNNIINNCLKQFYKNVDYEVKHCLECSEELIIFTLAYNENTLSIFRYSEKENKCRDVLHNFEYHNGNLITRHTYNKDDLIIAISEYTEDNDINIPLRVLNLGSFYGDGDKYDYNIINNNNLHSINPVVKIPTIQHTLINGHSYKGWHHIFVRYKISKDTYTQWFSTNYSVFLDEYINETISKFIVSNKVKSEHETGHTESFITRNISNELDICNNTYKLNINNLNNIFLEYQIGVIVINKTTTKAFCSNDLDININDIIFYNFKEYNVSDILINYYNYYNIKSLEIFNNKLYISNYKEYDKTIDVSDIKIDIIGVSRDVDITGASSEDDPIPDPEEPSEPDPEEPSEPDPEEPSEPEIKEEYVKYNGYANKSNQIPDIQLLKQYIYLNNIKYEYISNAIVRYEKTSGDYYVDNLINYTSEIYLIFNLYKLINNSITIYGHYIIKTFPKYVSILNIQNVHSFNNLALISNNNIEKPWMQYVVNEAGSNPGILREQPIKILTKDEFDYAITTDVSFVNNEAIVHGNNIIDNYVYLDYLTGNWNWGSSKNMVKTTRTAEKPVLDKYNCFNIDINEYYSFYIHFVNKYGEISKGYQLKNFNNVILNSPDININTYEQKIDIKSVLNNNNKKLIYFRDSNDLYDISQHDKFKCHYLKFKIDKLPKNYIGYFVQLL